MPPIVETSWESLCKHGEELCGDWVKITSTSDSMFVVLSDGLGSGVKANILATLTAEIASTMLVQGARIDDVVETLVEALPECQVRHLAYATFAVLRIIRGREAYLAEYDSPPMIMVRGNRVLELPMTERSIAGRTIREGSFSLELGDYMVMLSDGYIHAGVGGMYRMGWGWKNIAIAVERWAATFGDTDQLTSSLTRTCLKLSKGAPGDDATAITMRVRPRRKATILTGPPADPARDAEVVARFMETTGAKAICGGSTAQMVARELKQQLQVLWHPNRSRAGRSMGEGLPPIGQLDGVDLVTEGILTLSATVDRMRNAKTIRDLPPEQDGATRLARMLLETDEITVIVGDAVNPQQLADVVRGRPMRQLYLDDLVEQLRQRNKRVVIQHV